MFWNKNDKVVTQDTILKQYRKLSQTPSGNRHGEEYIKLHEMVSRYQDELYDLIFSGKVTDERDLNKLIFFGGHGGSVGKDYNSTWIPFLRRVKDRISELPESIQSHFDWLGKVHHYWDTETEDCIRLLDKILLTDGNFDYEVAMQRLNKMRVGHDLTAAEYLTLVDACNHRNEDGHYRDCIIYARALAEKKGFNDSFQRRLA